MTEPVCGELELGLLWQLRLLNRDCWQLRSGWFACLNIYLQLQCSYYTHKRFGKERRTQKIDLFALLTRQARVKANRPFELYRYGTAILDHQEIFELASEPTEPVSQWERSYCADEFAASLRRVCLKLFLRAFVKAANANLYANLLLIKLPLR